MTGGYRAQFGDQEITTGGLLCPAYLGHVNWWLIGSVVDHWQTRHFQTGGLPVPCLPGPLKRRPAACLTQEHQQRRHHNRRFRYSLTGGLPVFGLPGPSA